MIIITVKKLLQLQENVKKRMTDHTNFKFPTIHLS